MKSLYAGNVPGNMKLRGKLTKACPRGCCTVRNFKPAERVKEAEKEMKEYAPEQASLT